VAGPAQAGIGAAVRATAQGDAGDGESRRALEGRCLALRRGWRMVLDLVPRNHRKPAHLVVKSKKNDPA
jgi:hypothetical protein